MRYINVLLLLLLLLLILLFKNHLFNALNFLWIVKSFMSGTLARVEQIAFMDFPGKV